MPRPPNFDTMSDLSFIVNYLMQGCSVPTTGIFELSKAPLADLAMITLVPDPTDIIQALIGPKSMRTRRPGRHGRKRAGVGFPDPSDLVGGAMRGEADLTELHRLTRTKFAFRVWNAYEGFNFGIALVDGLSNVGFETFWGSMLAHPELCPGMAYFHRYDIEDEWVLGIHPDWIGIGLPVLKGGQGFTTPTGLVAACMQEACTAAFSLTGRAFHGNVEGFAIALVGGGGQVKAQSGRVNLSDGETVHLAIDAEFEKGEPFGWVANSQFGNVLTSNAHVAGWGGTWA